MITINNMNMPKSCQDCRFTFNSFDGSTKCILGAKIINWSERSKDCPLVAFEERLQGEWIETTWFTEIAGSMLQCPICHEETLTLHKSFCPNCGAKLNLKETESDDDPPMEYFENGGI